MSEDIKIGDLPPNTVPRIPPGAPQLPAFQASDEVPLVLTAGECNIVIDALCGKAIGGPHILLARTGVFVKFNAELNALQAKSIAARAAAKSADSSGDAPLSGATPTPSPDTAGESAPPQ